MGKEVTHRSTEHADSFLRMQPLSLSLCVECAEAWHSAPFLPERGRRLETWGSLKSWLHELRGHGHFLGLVAVGVLTLCASAVSSMGWG